MNKTEQAQQLRLAAELIETGHPFEVKLKGLWERITHASPIWAIANSNEIRPMLATPPDNRPLHNPDGLSAELVGFGYRLIVKDEKPTPGAQIWMGQDHPNNAWQKRDVETDSYYAGTTYRLPLSVPWPQLPIATLAQDQVDLPAEIHAVVDAVLSETIHEPPPFQLPPPPPNMRWHREDGWKEGDLPHGYRPLTDGECRKNEDEWTYGDGNGWRMVANYGPEGEVRKGGAKHRTTRPLIFTHGGKEWTYHRPGDPMPCEEHRIYILCKDGIDRKNLSPKDCRWSEENTADIIGWRYAETTKTVELGPEDVPPGSVLKANSWALHEWRSVGHVYADGVLLSNCPATAQWSHLMPEYQINRSIPLTGKWDANAWEPCSKEVKA